MRYFAVVAILLLSPVGANAQSFCIIPRQFSFLAFSALASCANLLGSYNPVQGFTIGAGAAQLPAAGTAGRRAYVSDQLTTCAAPGAALTGGGSKVCPVFDNGTAWVGG
jgi:hypothetical protein